MIRLTEAQIRWYRLRRSGLVEPFDGVLTEAVTTAVSTLAGIQAQILPAAAISLWNRTTGLTYARFEEMLFTERSLVKLWGQRQTLHLYTSREWPLFHAAMPLEVAWQELRAVKSGVDRAQYQQLVADLAELLRQRGIMGRSDLRDSDLDVHGDLFSAWGGIFRDLVYRGHACHAGRDGSEGLFAHRDHWLPDLKWVPPNAEAANIELVWRFLHAYGPATVQDIGYWRGRNLSDIRRWLKALGEGVVEVDAAGTPMLALLSDLETMAETPPEREAWPIRLLYRFEPLLLGHREKSWLIDMDYYKRVWRPAGHIEGVVLEHGRIVGTWRYDRSGSGIGVTVEPFGRGVWRGAVETAVSHHATQLASFFSLPLTQFIIN